MFLRQSGYEFYKSKCCFACSKQKLTTETNLYFLYTIICRFVFCVSALTRLVVTSKIAQMFPVSEILGKILEFLPSVFTEMEMNLLRLPCPLQVEHFLYVCGDEPG